MKYEVVNKIYIYIYVCVCVCVYLVRNLKTVHWNTLALEYLLQLSIENGLRNEI